MSIRRMMRRLYTHRLKVAGNRLEPGTSRTFSFPTRMFPDEEIALSDHRIRKMIDRACANCQQGIKARYEIIPNRVLVTITMPW